MDTVYINKNFADFNDFEKFRIKKNPAMPFSRSKIKANWRDVISFESFAAFLYIPDHSEDIR